ncbi:Porin gram-negative type [Cupriavidus necator]|uniref:Porin gram-negative type n=2 Tax=Cupriavidus necator TaxID=106590 RepID=A0A1K0ILJ7_CUPNE|nr:Porin gram-negative type [Cupriavidus necator]
MGERGPMKSFVSFLFFVLCSTAWGQSLTLYGVIDIAIAKNPGAGVWAMQNGSGNRFGLRGTEDLGGGMTAFFNVENRFAGDTGAMREPGRLFNDRSMVGIQGRFGRFWLGREYTPASWNVQIPADPLYNSTLMSMFLISTGGIGRVYNNGSVNYQFDADGLSITGQVAETEDNKVPHRPVSFSVSYRAGSVLAAYGYDRPGGDRAIWHMATGVYETKNFTLRAAVGGGMTDAGNRRVSMILGATIPIRNSQIHISHGKLRDTTADRTLMVKTGIAYYYSLSKRTSLYADIVHDSNARPHHFGGEIGIKHRF